MTYFDLPVDNSPQERYNASAKAIAMKEEDYDWPAVAFTVLLHCPRSLPIPSLVPRLA